MESIEKKKKKDDTRTVESPKRRPDVDESKSRVGGGEDESEDGSKDDTTNRNDVVSSYAHLRRRSSRQLFNHLAQSLLLHIEKSLLNDRTCNEIISHQTETSTLKDKAVKEAVGCLNQNFAERMKQSIEDAFQHFDTDQSKTIDKIEVESFLQSYCEWMRAHHWNLLQKPRLKLMVHVMACTLCIHINRDDLRESVEREFNSIILLEEFERAASDDVEAMSRELIESRGHIAEDLIRACDKNADGVLDLHEFMQCANLDFIQKLSRKKGESSYSALWREKARMLVDRFCVLSRTPEDPPPPSEISSSGEKGDEERPRHQYQELRVISRHRRPSVDTSCQICTNSGCTIS